MPFEPLRFIHATGAYLGRQLVCNEATDGAPDDVLESATESAFEQLITASLEKQVDFLLLVGNSFDQEACGPRDEAVLREGLRKLADHDIRVFVLAGVADPAVAWRRLDNLPDHVTPFYQDRSEPVACLRDGKVIATIAAGAIGNTTESETSGRSDRLSEESGRGPFRIGLINTPSQLAKYSPRTVEPIGGRNRDDLANSGRLREDELPASISNSTTDYVAVGGADARQTITLKQGIAHNPGRMLGFCHRDTGPRGCTLVDVDADGTVLCKFVPTAPVRWESFRLDVDRRTNREQLIDLMQDSLQRCRAEPTEHLWLVNWTVHGVGPLFAQLHDETFRSSLTDVVTQECASNEGLVVSHGFCLIGDEQRLQSYATDDSLLAEYLELKEAAARDPRRSFAACVEHSVYADLAWLDHLRSLIPEVDPDVVLGRARYFGEKWFATLAEKQSPDHGHVR